MHSLDTYAGRQDPAPGGRQPARRLKPTQRTAGAVVERDGRGCCLVLVQRLSGPVAAPGGQGRRPGRHRTTARAGASRLVTGDHPLLSELEARLARLKGTEACVVFGSGYLANTGVIPTFAGKGDIVLVDELAHACIWAGAQLSGAKIIPFAHNDVDHLADLLAEHPQAPATPSSPPTGCSRWTATSPRWTGCRRSARPTTPGCCRTTPTAWGAGRGRGSAALFPEAQIPFQMGTLSKALGSYGGYVCGSQAVVDLLKTRARTLVYTTGLPPAAAAAALAALDIIEADPALTALPLAKAQAFTAVGLPDATSPIVPVIIGEAQDALAASRALEAEGFLVVAIRPPTVPAGTARLRIAFSAEHPDAECPPGRLVKPYVKARPDAGPVRHRHGHRHRQDPCQLRPDPRPEGPGDVVDAFKPVVSGFDPKDAPETSDPARLAAALGARRRVPHRPAPLPRPLSPNIAARLEGETLAMDDMVIDAVARAAELRDGLLLVEGAGGVMSPLTDGETNLDMIAALACPVLLVAGSYLGTASHLLTALEVLRTRGLTVAAIVVSESVDAPDLDQTVEMLRAFERQAPIIVAPRNPDWDAAALSDLLLWLALYFSSRATRLDVSQRLPPIAWISA
jgi:8-amino-7-oxononanoate synthase